MNEDTYPLSDAFSDLEKVRKNGVFGIKKRNNPQDYLHIIAQFFPFFKRLIAFFRFREVKNAIVRIFVNIFEKRGSARGIRRGNSKETQKFSVFGKK